MKKLERVINLIGNEDKIVNFIGDMIGVRNGGDWNVYEENEEVKYTFEREDLCEDYGEYFEEEGISIEEIIEFIGEGFCLDSSDEGFDVWENVFIEGDDIVIKWVYKEI
jgi:hypothetical protein